MKFAILALALGALQAPPGLNQGSRADDRILQETGYTGDAGDEDGGWFQFAESRMRFRLPANSRETDTFIQILSRAGESGVAVRVRYDVTSGRPDAEGGYVEYELCSISVGNGASFGDEAANCPVRAAPALGPGQSTLVRGLAQVTASPEVARQALAAAVAVRDLDPRLRAIALEARGQAGGAGKYGALGRPIVRPAHV